MKTDRELLELAAKAVGKDLGCYEWYETPSNRAEFGYIQYAGDAMHTWNPLRSDGDALRLAVRLGFTVEPGKCWHSPYGPVFGEDLLDGEMTATRRAIVRAAAAIGEQMQ